MRKIIALLVFGILIFGCTMPGTSPGTGTGTGAGTGTGSGTGTQGTGGTQPPGGQTQPPVTPPPGVNITPEQPPIQPPAVSPPPQTADRQKLIEWYVNNHLMDSQGGVKDSSGSEFYSSSSVWLVMEYALETNDRTLFDKEFQFLKERQLDPTYSLAYAQLQGPTYTPVRKNSRYYSSNGNDIRIIRFLYEAKDKWGSQDYSTAAKKIGDSLLAYGVFEQIFMKETSWSGGSITPATRMRTADPEWVALQRLASDKEEWQSVMERTRSHTLGCGESGLFWPEYNAANPMCEYAEGESIAKTTDIATTAIALADVETLETAIITFSKLTNEYNRDYIISEGYTISFNGVGNTAENPATYAVVGRLAVNLDRCDFAAKMRDEVLGYFISDSASPLYGSVAIGGKAYAYDNLQTLLFLEEYADKC